MALPKLKPVVRKMGKIPPKVRSVWNVVQRSNLVGMIAALPMGKEMVFNVKNRKEVESLSNAVNQAQHKVRRRFTYRTYRKATKVFVTIYRVS